MTDGAFTPAAPAGVDAESVGAWLVDNIDDVLAPFTFTALTGGASNLTYRVDDAAGRSLVLRRPPTDLVLASAHDMAREHSVVSALDPTPVPVAPALGLCTDTEVNGAPFYVMGFVEGSVVFDHDDALAIDPVLRPRITESLVDTLVALHSIEPDAVGLADLGRRDDYCGRQLRRWKRQIDQGSDRDLPLLDDLHRRMTSSVPPQRRDGIVHGDYRLDNCIIGADGAVAAVLDWELCTLGDVLADLAGMVMWWGDDDTAIGRLAEVPTRADGFGTSEDMVARYGEATDLDLSDLPWHVAFQHWRLACISEGVRVRYQAGAMGDQSLDTVAEYGAAVDYLLERSREILDAC